MATKLDPDKGAFIFACGKKGSGKSVLCKRFFDEFPYDRLVIDPTGDVTEQLVASGEPVVRLDPANLPLRFPQPEDGQTRVTAALVPDMGSPTAVDDMDRALGLALKRQRTMVWIDEIGVMTTGQSTPPALSRALHAGRHARLTLLMAGPRPIQINPLVIAQADLVAVFRLPNPADRRRVADEIGYDPKSFDAAVLALQQYWYLLYDARAENGRGELYEMPPLPTRRVTLVP